MKDDAIAQLSDQVMALTARMHEIERKHHNNAKSYKVDSLFVNYLSYNYKLFVTMLHG